MSVNKSDKNGSTIKNSTKAKKRENWMAAIKAELANNKFVPF